MRKPDKKKGSEDIMVICNLLSALTHIWNYRQHDGKERYENIRIHFRHFGSHRRTSYSPSLSLFSFKSSSIFFYRYRLGVCQSQGTYGSRKKFESCGSSALLTKKFQLWCKINIKGPTRKIQQRLTAREHIAGQCFLMSHFDLTFFLRQLWWSPKPERIHVLGYNKNAVVQYGRLLRGEPALYVNMLY